MKRLLTLCILVTAIALVTGSAFAEVQNVKVSGDIDSKWIYRSEYDFNSEETAANNEKDNDNWFMTTATVQIDADLTDNVGATVKLFNERDWTIQAANTTEVDVALAYVTLEECFYSPLTLTVGRQNLRFGNGLVVGDPYTNDTEAANARITADDLSIDKGFDAVRATLDYEPTVIDLIFAKVNANNIWIVASGAGTDIGPRDDVDLYGINVAYDFNNKYNATVEGYVFSRINKTNETLTDTCHVIGACGTMDPWADLMLSGELAFQKGDYRQGANVLMDRDAWAGDIGMVYDGLNNAVQFLPGLSLRAGYSHRTGASATNATDVDALVTTDEFTAWDPMYEDQTHGMIANYIFDGINDGVDSNGRTFNVGASCEPLADLTLAVDYYHYRLDEKWYSTGAAAQNRTLNGIAYGVNGKKELGNEIDVVLNYAYTEDVNMGLACGWFLPGDAFDNCSTANEANNNDTATEVIASLGVAF